MIQAYADASTVAVLEYEGRRRAEDLSEHLRRALDSRVVIEQAKGMVAAELSVHVDRAFERLRAVARSAAQERRPRRRRTPARRRLTLGGCRVPQADVVEPVPLPLRPMHRPIGDRRICAAGGWERASATAVDTVQC